MTIKLVVFDFDGTITDGTVLFGNTPEAIFKGYYVRDGLGIMKLRERGVKIGVISGFKENKSTREICQHLKVEYISMGSNDKINIIKNWMDKMNITYDNVAFMGDDINDLSLLKIVGVSGCPSDARQECINIVNFISKYPGGRGAVREFCDLFP